MDPAAHSEATPTATAELRASEARMRALFDATSQGVIIMKLVRDQSDTVVDAEYLEVNPAFERLTGLNHASVVGRRSSEVFPLDFTRWQPRLATVKGTAGPERFETFISEVGRWFSCYAAPLDGHDGFAVFFDDVSDRKQRENQQTFLLTLSDALRPLTDAAVIQQTAARVLGEHLGVIRAMYAEVTGEPGAEVGTLRGQYHRAEGPGSEPVLPPFPERYSYDGYGERVMALRRRGETMVVADVATDERFEADEGAAWVAGGVRAAVTVALVKGGRFVADFGVQSAAPRDWTPAEVALVEETAERTWAAVERARAEGALRESEARYRTLFDSIDEGFCVIEVLFDEDWPVDYRFLETNPAFIQQTGLTDAVGRRMRELAPAHEHHWFDIYGRVALTGEPTRFQAPAMALGQRWYDVYAFRLGEPGANRVAILFTDISERKRAEIALRESEAREAFLLALSDAIAPLGDAEAIKLTAVQVLGRHLRASRVAYAEDSGDGEHYDVSRNYVDGAADASGRFSYADFGADLLSDLQAGRTRVQPDIRNDERLTDAEKQALADYGIGASLNVPLVKDGRFVALLGVNFSTAHEFTPREIELVREVAARTWAAVERARAEAALRESEMRTRFQAELLASAAEGMVATDEHLTITYWNRAAEELLGWTAEEALGQPSGSVFRTTVPGSSREAVIARLLEHGGYHGEVIYRHKDGRAVQAEVRSAALRGPGGEFRGTVSACFDVTARKRAEEALRESEARQAFLLTLSDAMRACSDDERAIKQLTVTMLGEHLHLDRCYVSEVFEDEDYSTVGPEHVRPGLPSMVGRYRLSDYPETQRQMATQPLVIDDADNDPRFSDEQKAMLALVPQRALLVAPLRKGPRKIVWALAGAMATPRRWTDSERVLFEDVAERTWAAVERARAEVALRESEERYRTLFATMRQGYCDLELVRDADGRAVDQHYLELNPAFERIFGISIARAQGRKASEVFPELEPWWTESLDRIARAGTPERIEHEIASRGRWYEVQVFPRGGDRLLVFYEDITDRKLAEAARRQAQSTALEKAEQLTVQRTAERDVARWQLLEAEEVERRRLARELHDEAGQHLTAIGLGLQTLSDMAPPGSEVDRRAAQLRGLVAMMSRDLHAIAVRLRPRTLDDFGLEAALAAYVEVWSRQTGIAVGVHAPTGADRLPGAIESAVYRVVQEALTNVARHSGAARASVIVERRDGQVHAIVEDDGRGFDADALGQSPRDGSGGGGLGLRGIRERASLLGGMADVESTPNGGTTVFVRIPIHAPLP